MKKRIVIPGFIGALVGLVVAGIVKRRRSRKISQGG